MGTRTPWGMSDGVEKLAVGINFYSTPSHGGIGLSNSRIAELEEWYKRNHLVLKNWLGTPRWWEEDCDWAIPFLLFIDDIEKYVKKSENDLFDQERMDRYTEGAVNTVKFNAPDVFYAIRESRPGSYLRFDVPKVSKESILGG